MEDKREMLPMVLRENIPKKFEKIRDTPLSKDDEDFPVHRYLRKNNIKIDPTGSDIINFLKGKHIFISGATGFIGKLLVEKLIRCCPDIGGIYVIIRNKKGKHTEERVQEFLNHEFACILSASGEIIRHTFRELKELSIKVFLPLGRLNPNYKQKVIGIEGDISLPGLGISDKSRQLLVDKINIIYHIAATVRFYEKIKLATDINIRGTKEIIKLAKECKNLAALVHMSTAYSNCNQKVIDEEFYKPVIPPEDVIKLTETLDENVLDRITPSLLGDLPNTYTFTKQIAEDVVKREALGLPACVHRPSIVFTTYNEPVIAWSDNLFGPIGILTGGGIGVLHIMKAKPQNVADIVPADYVINSCIVSSYKTAIDRNLQAVPIYNYVSSPQNPVTWEQIRVDPGAFGKRISSVKTVYHSFLWYTESDIGYRILNTILHRAPAAVIDFVAKIKGQQPQLGKAYDKFEKFISVLEAFTLNQWQFRNKNMQHLWTTMSQKDQEIFPFDLQHFDWIDYFATFFMGVREFIVRDYLDTMEQSRTRAKRFKYINAVIVGTILFAIFWILKTIFSLIFF